MNVDVWVLVVAALVGPVVLLEGAVFGLRWLRGIGSSDDNTGGEL